MRKTRLFVLAVGLVAWLAPAPALGQEADCPISEAVWITSTGCEPVQEAAPAATETLESDPGYSDSPEPPSLNSWAEETAPAAGPSHAEIHQLPWDGPRWRKLRSCESGSGADSRSGLYHGYYQFTLSSWRGAGGWGDPHAWTLHEQTARARWWWDHTNPSTQWPVCWRAAAGLPDRD